MSFQSSDLDCLVTSTIDNSDPLKVEVRFEKVSSCIKGILQIQVCYNFGAFSNLQELCDTDDSLLVINSLGSCFAELAFSEDPVPGTSRQVTLNEEPSELFDLTSLVRMVTDDLACGSLGFQLVDDT